MKTEIYIRVCKICRINIKYSNRSKRINRQSTFYILIGALAMGNRQTDRHTRTDRLAGRYTELETYSYTDTRTD